MADLVFNRTTSELTAFGKTWKAVSGGKHYKPLQTTKERKRCYEIPARALMVGTKNDGTTNGAIFKGETVDLFDELRKRADKTLTLDVLD